MEGHFFYNLFYFMEDQGVLDALNVKNLAALHYIYMDGINRRLQFWARAWSRHRIRTVKASPIQFWLSGGIQNPVGIPSTGMIYKIMVLEVTLITLMLNTVTDQYLNQFHKCLLKTVELP